MDQMQTQSRILVPPPGVRPATSTIIAVWSEAATSTRRFDPKPSNSTLVSHRDRLTQRHAVWYEAATSNEKLSNTIVIHDHNNTIVTQWSQKDPLTTNPSNRQECENEALGLWRKAQSKQNLEYENQSSNTLSNTWNKLPKLLNKLGKTTCKTLGRNEPWWLI